MGFSLPIPFYFPYKSQPITDIKTTHSRHRPRIRAWSFCTQKRTTTLIYIFKTSILCVFVNLNWSLERLAKKAPRKFPCSLYMMWMCVVGRHVESSNRHMESLMLACDFISHIYRRVVVAVTSLPKLFISTYWWRRWWWCAPSDPDRRGAVQHAARYTGEKHKLCICFTSIVVMCMCTSWWMGKRVMRREKERTAYRNEGSFSSVSRIPRKEDELREVAARANG